MRRTTLLLCAIALFLLLGASGVALAMTIDCIPNTTCNGTNNSDTINGTTVSDGMNGRAGNDLMRGKGGGDEMRGGKGADKVSGGPGGDAFLWGGAETTNSTFPDKSDDTVKGALGNDVIDGGFGQGGVDHVFGGDGNDTIVVAQRGFPSGEVKVTGTSTRCATLVLRQSSQRGSGSRSTPDHRQLLGRTSA
jgi:Ca2+-binding RTX toxin-like protein